MSMIESNFEIPSLDSLLASDLFWDLVDQLNLVEVATVVESIAQLGLPENAIDLFERWIERDEEATVELSSGSLRVSDGNGNWVKLPVDKLKANG
ncbi:hypothetical protein [Corynebacterium epidermidicanis]|uniref:Uncharacterized protein n=1 Tax=Corynebacterium epidermidicanis TaxID=1050174 RepID=A0A0G3GVG0_9CORY|nr:hypothetical protein [Corynebacterium epidermidicanis]AKK02847.1 hypothetical protein CEPID_04885 [Corynebacterium epidermidicanis]